MYSDNMNKVKRFFAYFFIVIGSIEVIMDVADLLTGQGDTIRNLIIVPFWLIIIFFLVRAINRDHDRRVALSEPSRSE